MLLTVDFWDTVLRRSCHPNLIKRLTAQHLLLQQRECLRPGLREVEKLFQARRRVERQLGKKRLKRGLDFEYEINEVMAEWLEEVCEPPPGADSCLASSLATWEWEREKALSSPDAGIVAVLEHWRERGAKIFFISDFYMTSERLMALLQHHGLRGYFEGGITSAEVRLNKRSGRLFQWVQRRWLGQREAHVHLGDDQHADVDVPRKLGIQAIHYCPAAEHRHRLDRERAYVRSRHDPLAGLAEAAPQPVDASARMAVQLAPLFLGFALFLYEQACATGAERVVFVSREGPFLERTFRAVAERHPLGRRVATAVLPCSRASTFAPSLDGWDLAEIDSWLKKAPEQTPETFCRAVGFPIDALRPGLQELGIAEGTCFRRADRDSRFRRWIDSPAMRRAAETALPAARALLDQMLDQCGWTRDLTKVIVADVGWFGSMQENLSRLRPRTETVGVYLGIKQPADPDRPGRHRVGYVFDGRTAPSAIDPYFDIAPPIEILCSTNEPSVTAYAWDEREGRVRPVVSGPGRATAKDWMLIANFQHAVLRTLEAYAASGRFWAVTAAELQPFARRCWREFIKDPVPEFATLFFRSPLYEEYGIRGPADLPAIVDTNGTSPAGGGANGWLRSVRELRMLPWPQGFANSQLCSRAARGFLKLTLPAAYGVRRLRNELAVRREARARGYTAQPSGAH